MTMVIYPCRREARTFLAFLVKDKLRNVVILTVTRWQGPRAEKLPVLFVT